MSQVYDSAPEALKELRVSETRYGGRRLMDRVLAGERQAISFKIRLIFYVLLAALFMQSLVMLLKYQSAELLFSEQGVVEWVEAFMLLLCAVLLQASSKSMAEISEGTYLISFLPLLAAVREMDQFLKDYLFNGAWEVLAVGLIAYMGYFLYLHWQDIKQQLTRILAVPPAGLLFSGFLTVIVFSRFFGQGLIWEYALQEHYVRLVQRIVEETCESFGYLLLVFGCIELLIFTLSCKPDTKRNNPS